MEVYKRPGSASWYVDLVHPATKKRVRQSLKFEGPKVQAQKRADQLQRELEKEATQYEEGRRPTTLGAAIEAYVSMLEAKGQVSAKDHRYRMNRLLGYHTNTQSGIGHAGPGMVPTRHVLDPATPLHDLTPAAMEALSLARTREGKKPQTIKHELGLIRAAARYAAGLGYRTPTIMTKGEVENPWRVPEVAQKTRYLSPEEYGLVYDYLNPERLVSGGGLVPYRLPEHLRLARQESQDLLVALAYTGGRWSEIALLTWDRVDAPRKTIRLWAGKVEKERIVPIADPLYDVLYRRGGLRPDGKWSTEGLVFPGPGGRPRTKPTDAIVNAMDAVGLNRPDVVAKYGRATVHSLRHTFASWLIQNGADLSEVKDALGHSTVTTTTRYAHLAKGATMAKLGGILSKIGGSNARDTLPEVAGTDQAAD